MAKRNTDKNVYAWAQAVSMRYGRQLDEYLTLDECQALAAHVCGEHGADIPTVEDNPHTQTASATLTTIKLPKWAQTNAGVLHEVTHVILKAQDNHSHDSEFTTLYVSLMAQYAGVDAGRIKEMGTKYGVKFA